MINWKQLNQELPDTSEVQEALTLLQQVELKFGELDYDIVTNTASVIKDELTRDVVIDLVLDAIEREHPLYDEILEQLLNDVVRELKR